MILFNLVVAKLKLILLLLAVACLLAVDCHVHLCLYAGTCLQAGACHLAASGAPMCTQVAYMCSCLHGLHASAFHMHESLVHESACHVHHMQASPASYVHRV